MTSVSSRRIIDAGESELDIPILAAVSTAISSFTDLARELKMSHLKLRDWNVRGWVHGVRQAEKDASKWSSTSVSAETISLMSIIRW
jgi:hypothetical protein